MGEIISIVFKHDPDDFSFWTDFVLSKEDENTIMNILSKYETEGFSIRGTKEEIIADLN